MTLAPFDPKDMAEMCKRQHHSDIELEILIQFHKAQAEYYNLLGCKIVSSWHTMQQYGYQTTQDARR